jgi:serpin B
MSPDDPLDDALHSLDRPAGNVPWREPDEIRRIAKRRTITRRSAVGVAGLAVAGGVVDALWPSGSSGTHDVRHRLASGLVENDRVGSAVELVADVKPLPTTANDITPIATAEQQFAIDILRAVPATDKNVVLSPSSLATALAMLQLGAAGSTRDEIAHVLHTDHLSSQQQALGWAALTKSLADTGVVESANSLWQQHGLKLTNSFMSQLARYFEAGVWQVDFAQHMGDATAAINQWCSDNTHGRITKLFDQLDPATVLVLANAEYFKASWKYQFDPKLTQPGPFHHADGSTSTVPFMHMSGRAAFLVTQDFYGAQLPYAGDRFVAQFIAPTTGSLTDLVARLTPNDFETIAKGAVDPEADLVVPRFTTATFTDLVSPLAHLGMRTAFSDSADFSPLSPAGLSVSQVVQRDYLKVDEVGTEAAAVSAGGMGVQARTVTPVFDKPFLFLVRDTQTGVVLFAGQIVDPSAS